MPCRNLPEGLTGFDVVSHLVHQSSFEEVLLVPAACSRFARWAPMRCQFVCVQTVAERMFAGLELLAAFGNSLGCSYCMNAAAALEELDRTYMAGHPKQSVAEGLCTIGLLAAGRSVR